MIWKVKPSPEILNKGNENTLVGHLGLIIKEVGEDHMSAEMLVDEKSIQPWGIMNGGVSAVISETLGSIASSLCIDLKAHKPVGIEINVNHLKALPKGITLKAITSPIKIGRKLHVWETKIFNEKGDLCAVSRLTVMILENA